jgi:hypothetical protein
VISTSQAPLRAQSIPVRRLAPWFLGSLLLVGTIAVAAPGTAQGSSSRSPSRWVADVIATTEGAGSAHFSYSNVTSSPNPELRGSLAGHGEIDFTTGDVRATEVDHDITFSATGHHPLRPVRSTTTLDAIVIGGTVYQANPMRGVALTKKYSKLPSLGVPHSQQGLFLALNASVALDELRGPYAVASVTDLGPAKVAGVATTQYEVKYAPLHVCLPHKAPQVLTQRPSRVWTDDAGRIARVRSTLYFNDRQSREANTLATGRSLPHGAVTTAATLTISEYGVPVRVTAPPKSAVLPESGSSSGLAVAGSDTCR